MTETYIIMNNTAPPIMNPFFVTHKNICNVNNFPYKGKDKIWVKNSQLKSPSSLGKIDM